MYWFRNIIKFLKFIFDKLSFRNKTEQEIFYDDYSSHTEYEYIFNPINEKMDI